MCCGEDPPQRVRAVVERHPSVYGFASYVPMPGPVARTIEWSRRGARIEYFSPHRRVDDIEAAEEVRPAG